jgi:hypothetical protein
MGRVFIAGCKQEVRTHEVPGEYLDQDYRREGS